VTDARDAERRSEEIANLRAVYQSLQRPEARRSGRARGVFAGTAVAGLLFVLTKAKFLGLLAGVFKFKTLATMLLDRRVRDRVGLAVRARIRAADLRSRVGTRLGHAG
jgi:hypothetical protein